MDLTLNQIQWGILHLSPGEKRWLAEWLSHRALHSLADNYRLIKINAEEIFMAHDHDCLMVLKDIAEGILKRIEAYDTKDN